MIGPDVDQLASVLAATATPGDRERRASASSPICWRSRPLDVDGRELAGAIVGRAIYEGRFTVAEALDALAL